MSDEANYRLERITRLLKELEYEVVRGMMEREIDEEMTFQFYVPLSQRIHNGVVFCSFRTRPMPAPMMQVGEPRLHIVKNDKAG